MPLDDRSEAEPAGHIAEPPRMEKIVPAVSSSVRGPLGIAHLPRMWLTAIAHARGQLADGYGPGGDMDHLLADDLRIEKATFATFLKTVPTFAETEAWVRTNAGRIDGASIAAHNERIEVARPAVMRSDLEDWSRIHAFLASRRGAKVEPMVPLVSMDTAGPLGIKLLPRFWVKALIHEAGALPDTWRSGETRVVYTDGVPGTLATPGQGMDASTVANLALDMDATIGYLHRDRPTYPEFEAWVSANAGKLDTAAVAAHNAGPAPVSGERPVAELTRMGYPDMSACGMYLYNDLADWDAVREQLLKRG
jgi:hypothetical protein